MSYVEVKEDLGILVIIEKQQWTTQLISIRNGHKYLSFGNLGQLLRSPEI